MTAPGLHSQREVTEGNGSIIRRFTARRSPQELAAALAECRGRGGGRHVVSGGRTTGEEGGRRKKAHTCAKGWRGWAVQTVRRGVRVSPTRVAER